MTELGKKAGEKLSAYDEETNTMGEGNGTATLYRYDPQFPPEGVDDMVKLTQLNNAELGRNIKVHRLLSSFECE